MAGCLGARGGQRRRIPGANEQKGRGRALWYKSVVQMKSRQSRGLASKPRISQCFVQSSRSGARRGNRTHTLFREPDFESGASTSSAIRAYQAAQYI
jgi:hypothetical protein